MKKWLKGLAVGLLALALVACSDAANEPADAKPGTDEAKKSELTLEEVFQKAQEASEGIKSMHADMSMIQNISSPEADVEMDNNIKMKMDIVQEPFSMYQIMEMEIVGEGSMKTEMYLTEAGFYMKDPDSGTWMKLPNEGYEDLAAAMTTGEDVTVDYSSLKEFIDDFKFEQNDNEYVLKLKASGDKFNKLIQEEIASTGLLEDLSEEELEALDDVKIHELEYEIFINKETFETTAFNIVMDMEMSAEGETVQIKQEIQSKLSRINEIDEITVPQEVLDNAVEY
ncbi:DUF6612 family protein [Sporosarcina ureilytica]|uniref:Lipoprotein n=1 Tax=Sporosarcina ureilytica TaxID=298596 RepID=A0A1D8JD36_9BACL|nr:DUF6612 family protein [Sporosarcina ureilytica]AOV06615.1 hypothetical protein BI350_02660 [Sporosarcina ureilytica]